MEAGKLRHFITIEQATVAQDEYGEPVATWGRVAEVWASREDLSGRELFAAQQVKAEVTTRFVLRYIDGLSPQMRVSSDGMLYNIESVQDATGRKRELILICSRDSGEGAPIYPTNKTFHAY